MSEKNGNAAGNGQKQDEGRTPGGRFAPGNKGGPGNPFARRTAEMRRAIQNAVTPEEMAAVARVMYERALKGDVAAAKLLYAYGAGRPTEGADPDTLDAHELEVRRANVATDEDVSSLKESVPAWVLCNIAEAVVPEKERMVYRLIGEGIREMDAREKAKEEDSQNAVGGQRASKKDRPPSPNGSNGNGDRRAGRGGGSAGG